MNLDGLTEKKNHVGTVYYVNSSGAIVAKRCSNCTVAAPLEDFSSAKNGLGGKHSQCKYCKAKYYEDNKERRKAWHEANKERISEQRHQHYIKNREKRREINRKYYLDNKEKMIKKATEWISENRDKHAEYRKKWEQNNSDRLTEYRQQYYEENREKEKVRKRRYKKENPLNIKIQEHRRRARKRNLPHTLTLEEYRKTLEHFGNRCALTGVSKNLEKEHAIPLSVGHGGTTFANCYPMASGLNQSKHNHNIFEWFEANRQRFNLEQSRFDRLIEWLGKANGMTVEEYRDYVYWCHANPRSIDELKAQ